VRLFSAEGSHLLAGFRSSKKGAVITLEGLSSLAATVVIAYHDRER